MDKHNIYKWINKNEEISLLWQLVSLMLFKSIKLFYKLKQDYYVVCY